MHRISFTVFHHKIDISLSSVDIAATVAAVALSVASTVMYLWPYIR